MQSTESLVAIALNSSLQRYGGDLAVGSMTIMTSVMQFVMLPLFGLVQGAQPIISFNYGAQKTDRVKRAFRLLLCCCLGYTIVFFAAVMLFPQGFIRCLTATRSWWITPYGASAFILAAAFMLGAQNACQQTFVALGQARKSLDAGPAAQGGAAHSPGLYPAAFFADKVFAVILAEPVADFVRHHRDPVGLCLFVFQDTARFRPVRAGGMTACSSRDARAAKVERAAAPNGFCGTSIILRAKRIFLYGLRTGRRIPLSRKKDWSPNAREPFVNNAQTNTCRFVAHDDE